MSIGGRRWTWRSGIGLSANKKFLYYVAGPGLTVPTLANVLKTIGAVDAMQLDINPYWVHFVSVQHLQDRLKADPLLPEMHDNPDRYFYNYSRDYFYVTTHNTEQ
ncbi:MAG: phosphodiester glycosidase family protein [Chloroflexi bacterium]|nr:phosphodiester glycosidase family protein [Chloroflexota bacterium]